MDPLKPGWRTTEFWTTLGVYVLGTIALFHPNVNTAEANSHWGAIVQAAGVIAAAAKGLAYSLGRAKVKAAAAVANPALIGSSRVR